MYRVCWGVLSDDDRTDENAWMELSRGGIDKDGVHQREQAPEPIAKYVATRRRPRITTSRRGDS